MKKTVNNLYSAFKEMWKYSSEATALVSSFSRVIVLLVYGSSILSAVASLGAFSFIGLLSGYAIRQGFDLKQNVFLFFWVFIAFRALVLIFKNLTRVYFLRENAWFEYALEDHYSDVMDKKLTCVSLADRISGVFTNIYRRAQAARMRDTTLEFLKFKSRVISAVIAVAATIAVSAFVNVWMILSILVVACISAKLRTRRYRRIYNKMDLRNRIHNRSSEYHSVIRRPSLYSQNFFFKTIPYFTEMYMEKKAEARVMDDQEKLDEVKTDFKYAMMRLFPILVFAFSVYGYIQNGDIQSVFIIFGCYQSLESTVSSFIHLYSDYDEEVLHMRDWQTFISFKSSIDESKCSAFVPHDVPTITLKDVSYSYPETENSALQNVSLTIYPREKVAIIGKNGSGKSTLFSLLTKVRLPTSGEVLYNDVSTEAMYQDSIAGFLSWVSGNCDLLELPLYEAVCGCAREHVDWDRLNRAASITGANQYIDKLSHGWDTSLDTTDEHHTEGFSDGQKQRLNLTALLYRALHEDVKILIFDEPMAHCDTDVKALFYKAIQNLGKTVVSAIHDPSYLGLFQRVIEVKDGKITEDKFN